MRVPCGPAAGTRAVADCGAPPVPLLLFNGIGASLELLQPFVDALDPAIEVVRFDVPGVGGSPLPAIPYRFTGLCRLTGQLLTELGYDRADVLGISWGGGVAQHFAFTQRRAAGGWCWLAPAPARSWCRPGRRCWRGCSTPRRYTDRGYLAARGGRPVWRQRPDRSQPAWPPR